VASTLRQKDVSYARIAPPTEHLSVDGLCCFAAVVVLHLQPWRRRIGDRLRSADS